MKTSDIILIIVFTVICLGGVYFRIRKHLKNTSKVIQDASRTVTGKNSYEELRNNAFAVTPYDLGLSLDENKTAVYGVVMDWEMRGAIVTVVTFKTGDASLYLSSGGAVIGGGQHENVNDAAKKLVLLAESFIDTALPAKIALLPQENRVRFYLLTNKGLYTAQEYMHNIDNATSKWYPLFVEANNVITAIRTVSEK